MDQLHRFIEATRRSEYHFEELKIHGPGEPTLWKHINPGLAALRSAGVADRIVLETNGKSLDRLARQSWCYLSEVVISFYPEHREEWLFGVPNLPIEQLRENRNKVRFELDNSFRVLPRKRHHDCLPARCACPGPMLYGDLIFLTCGPPVFEALDLMGEELSAFPELCRELAVGYLSDLSPKAPMLPVCEHCWANARIRLPARPWARGATTWQPTARWEEGPKETGSAETTATAAEDEGAFSLVRDDGTVAQITLDRRCVAMVRWLVERNEAFAFDRELAARCALPDADIWEVLDRLQAEGIIGDADGRR